MRKLCQVKPEPAPGTGLQRGARQRQSPQPSWVTLGGLQAKSELGIILESLAEAHCAHLVRTRETIPGIRQQVCSRTNDGRCGLHNLRKS